MSYHDSPHLPSLVSAGISGEVVERILAEAEERKKRNQEEGEKRDDASALAREAKKVADAATKGMEEDKGAISAEGAGMEKIVEGRDGQGCREE